MSGGNALRVAIALLACACTSHASAGVEAIDDRGVRVALAKPAERIVALAPSLAEAAHFAGADAKLVGTSSYTFFPASAAALPVVATPGRVDLERIAVLRPDLVLGWVTGNPARYMPMLARADRGVFMVEPRTLRDLARAVRSIGALTGTADAAERSARAFEADLARLRPTLRSSLRVFIEIWPDPPLTVNDQHLIADIVRECGGENVFGSLRSLTPRVSMEQLLVTQPDAIVTSAPLASEADRKQWARQHRDLRAVRRGRVVSVDADVLHRQSFRVIDAVRAVCEGLEAPRAVARGGGTRASGG